MQSRTTSRSARTGTSVRAISTASRGPRAGGWGQAGSMWPPPTATPACPGASRTAACAGPAKCCYARAGAWTWRRCRRRCGITWTAGRAVPGATPEEERFFTICSHNFVMGPTTASLVCRFRAIAGAVAGLDFVRDAVQQRLHPGLPRRLDPAGPGARWTRAFGGLGLVGAPAAAGGRGEGSFATYAGAARGVGRVRGLDRDRSARVRRSWPPRRSVWATATKPRSGSRTSWRGRWKKC